MLNTEDIVIILKEVRDSALARYSKFKVGAILITSEGDYYTGCNIESCSYSLTICAERVALYKALSQGDRKFTEIYIMGNHDKFCLPCGACRQVLTEYAPDLKIISIKETGECRSFFLRDLLPEAFSLDYFEK